MKIIPHTLGTPSYFTTLASTAAPTTPLDTTLNCYETYGDDDDNFDAEAPQTKT